MRYLRSISNYLEIIALSYFSHMMSMTDHVVISVETLEINSGYFLVEVYFLVSTFHSIDPYKSLNGIIPNCQSSLFMS